MCHRAPIRPTPIPADPRRWLILSALFLLAAGLLAAAACRPRIRFPEPPLRPPPGATERDTANLYEEVDEELEGPELAEFEQFNAEPYVLLGSVLTPDRVLEDGGVWVEDGIVQAVWAGDGAPPETAGMTTVSTRGGLILPGLVDIHNHVAYNFLPLWESDDAPFPNRYTWQRNSGYGREVSEPYGAAKRASLVDEMDKYGEIRGLIGGTTSILGAAPASGAGILVRNIDQRTLGRDLVRTHVGAVTEFGCGRGQALCDEQAGKVADLVADFDSGALAAIVFHVAEGVDELSREELDWLETTGLMRPEVVVTHGAAFGEAELRKLADAGMGLIWSPRSNLILYHDTADVVTARDLGVRLALAPDWSPSGSDNLLGELRYAAAYNTRVLSDAFTARELVAMATSTPAALVGRGGRLGCVEEGCVADLLVLERRDPDPWESVLRSNERHVRLVTVNGVPLYGFPSWLSRLGKAGDFERLRIRGRERALDTTVPAGSGVRKGEQTYADIRAALAAAYQPFGELPELTANGP